MQGIYKEKLMLKIDNGISLVKFAATWCAPCKTVATTIKRVQPEFTSVNFQEVDVDDHPNLAKDYKIRSVPTVIVFRNGEEITRLIGNFKVDALRKALRDVTKDQAA
jgi:thioredoxin 1